MLEYFSSVIFLIIVLEVSTHMQIRIINVIKCMKRSSSMIFFSLIFLFLVGLFTANPIIFGLTTSGPVPIPGSLLLIPVKSDSLISSSITITKIHRGCTLGYNQLVMTQAAIQNGLDFMHWRQVLMQLCFMH